MFSRYGVGTIAVIVSLLMVSLGIHGSIQKSAILFGCWLVFAGLLIALGTKLFIGDYVIGAVVRALEQNKKGMTPKIASIFLLSFGAMLFLIGLIQ